MKPKVLTFIRHYLPGYKHGGPIRSIANLIDYLGDDFLFLVVTSDRDATDTEPYPGIHYDTWNTVGKAKVFYTSPSQRGLVALASLMRKTPHDLLYLNSFFDPDYSIKPLLVCRSGLAPRTPCVIASRGEFSEGALALKAWKKKLFVVATRSSGLHSNVTWQASSDHEKTDIRRALRGSANAIAVAVDLPSRAAMRRAEICEPGRAPGAPVRVCFLSRVARMKNLDFALRVLALVRAPVQFNIYGPVDDDAYWAECKALIKALPAHISAHYAGGVNHKRVAEIMQAHDLFFFPTRGENYGHVILEALLSSTPVLLSDTTPWRNLERSGVGWDLPLDEEQTFAEHINEIAALPPDKYYAMRCRAHSFAVEQLHDDASVEANRNMLLRAIRRPKVH